MAELNERFYDGTLTLILIFHLSIIPSLFMSSDDEYIEGAGS